MRLISYILFIVTIGAFSAPVSAALKASKIVAVVNDSSILQSQIDDRSRLVLASSGRKITPKNMAEVREDVLQLLIDEEIKLGLQRKYEISIPESDIENSYADLEHQNGMAKGELDKFLKRHNISRASMLKQIKANIIWQAYVNEKFPQLVKVEDAEINRAVSEVERGRDEDQYLLAEIMVPFGNHKSESEVKSQIQSAHAKLKKGAHFQDVAQQFSESATAARGGDIGWMSLNRMDKELQAAVKGLKNGQFTSPIRTAKGYMIVMRRDRHEAGSIGASKSFITFRQALVPFPEEQTEYEMDRRYRLALDIKYRGKTCRAFERVTNEIPGAKFKEIAGMPTSELHPELRKLLGKLGKGEVTDPIGTQAGFMLFTVCDRQTVTPQLPSRDQLQARLKNERVAQIGQGELRRMRQESTIEIRA
ncbi:MAG: peptidylprolyl isomerase [Alphaproteobacteria bacterium]